MTVAAPQDLRPANPFHRTMADAFQYRPRPLGVDKADGAVEPIPVARYYKSRRLAPSEVDNMYSELLLLDLKLD